MPPSKVTYSLPADAPPSVLKEEGIEYGLIGRLQGLKYDYRPDITNRATLEKIVEYKNAPGNGYTKTHAGALGLVSFVIEHSPFDISQRPYQVYAMQRMVKCIDDDDGNRLIRHTIGSGKTLTSFKAPTLLKENDHNHKCVFVVERNDLDRLTREDWSSSDKTSSGGEARRGSAGSANQFNRFHEGCVEENTNTAALVRWLLSEDYADKVIFTTI